jgi:hypothetical protein
MTSPPFTPEAIEAARRYLAEVDARKWPDRPLLPLDTYAAEKICRALLSAVERGECDAGAVALPALEAPPTASGALIVYPNGTDKPGVTFPVANGFVSRVVSAVADVNIPDAEHVCAILNAHFEQGAKP